MPDETPPKRPIPCPIQHAHEQEQEQDSTPPRSTDRLARRPTRTPTDFHPYAYPRRSSPEHTISYARPPPSQPPPQPQPQLGRVLPTPPHTSTAGSLPCSPTCDGPGEGEDGPEKITTLFQAVMRIQSEATARLGDVKGALDADAEEVEMESERPTQPSGAWRENAKPP